MKKILSIALLLALFSVAFLPRQASAQTATDISITPTSGQPGDRFLVTATGFEANEQTVLWLNAPDGSTSSVGIYNPYQADKDGRVIFTWDSPKDIAQGPWAFVVHGLRHGVEQVVPFTIGTAPNPDSGVEAQIQPTSGTPSTTFTFFVTGFMPDELMSIDVFDPSGNYLTRDIKYSSYSDVNGRADGSFTIPVEGPLGTWHVIANGTESKVQRTIAFEIVSAVAPSAPTITVSPDSGQPGTRFLISASGYAANETVAVWMNAPDGTIYHPTLETRLDTPEAAPDGRVSISWVSPNGIQPGIWQMVIRGDESGFQQVVTIEILP